MTDELLNQLQELTQSANLTPSVESAIHNLMISAYREGCSEGYSKGYSEGFEEGIYQESYNNSMSYLGD